MNRPTRKKLIAYSLFAVAYNSGIKSQVNYFDFNPDIILDIDNDTTLDFDLDGMNDFTFSNESYSVHFSYSSSFVWTRYRQNLEATPEQTMNAIIGTSRYNYTDSGGFYRYYPAVLDFRSPVTIDQNWIDDNNQFLVWRSMFDPGSSGFDISGNWYPLQTDKYIGLRFQHNGEIHYGWIRCDVLNEGRLLILKDYAYEEVENQGIFAGSTKPINQPDSTFTSYVYTFNGVIHISFNFQFTIPITMQISDTEGKLIFEESLTQNNNTIAADIADGAYFIHFFSDDINETREIVIHH